jgi:protein tyrosine phosphatase
MTPYLSLRAPDVELGQRPCALTWKVNSISNAGNRAKGCKKHFILKKSQEPTNQHRSGFWIVELANDCNTQESCGIKKARCNRKPPHKLYIQCI